MSGLPKILLSCPTKNYDEYCAEIINICRERNELDFLFKITKQVAESDSIGESYSYCDGGYTKEQFNNAEKHITPDIYKKNGREDEYCHWLEYGGVPIYEIYLYHIGALIKQPKKK